MKKFVTLIVSDKSEPFDLIANKECVVAAGEIEITEVRGTLYQKSLSTFRDWAVRQIKLFPQK